MKKPIVAALAGAVALVGVLAPAATAAKGASDDSTEVVYLNPGNAGATAESYRQGGCDIGPGDVWHFVAPGTKSQFISLTLYYSPKGDPSTVYTVYKGSNFGPPSPKHAYVETDRGAVLVGGEAVVTGGTTGFFVLSGTCPGKAGGPQ